MPSRTKIFIAAYFLPAWISSLMMWGDERTSAGFGDAPLWFQIAKWLVQTSAILLLFMPLKLRSRPPPGALMVAVALVLSTFLPKPAVAADSILLNSSMQIGLLAVFLLIAKPSTSFEETDMRLLFALFIVGFLLQVVLYLAIGQMPSHSIRGVFIRFNGITNDSLSTGLLLALLIPWAVGNTHRLTKASALIIMSALTGSLFSAIFVLAATLAYAMYRHLYGFIATLIMGLMIAGAYFRDTIVPVFELKLLSILTHLRFFLNIGGIDLEQPPTTCSDEFCESFLEVGLHLNAAYTVLLYGLLFVFLVPLLRSSRAQDAPVRDSLSALGLTLLVATLVHPVPLIPFAIPLFLIFSTLYLSNQEPSRHRRAPDPDRRRSSTPH